jgi:uncharacterized membrane protein YgcG
MSLRSRLPVVLLALVALALGAVIVMRVSAGADPAPRNTDPIVIHPSTSRPTHQPTKKPTSTVTQIAPPPRNIDDDGHHQRGKGKGGGSSSGGDSGSGGGDD